MHSQRFESGLNTLNQINNQASQNILDTLKTIAPDFAKYIIEFPFGDIYQRSGLDLKSRQLSTIAALTALANCQPQLRVHIQGALNVGCKPEEVIEVIIQMSIYAGFPAAFNGLLVAKEVFIEHQIITA